MPSAAGRKALAAAAPLTLMELQVGGCNGLESATDPGHADFPRLGRCLETGPSAIRLQPPRETIRFDLHTLLLHLQRLVLGNVQ